MMYQAGPVRFVQDFRSGHSGLICPDPCGSGSELDDKRKKGFDKMSSAIQPGIPGYAPVSDDMKGRRVLVTGAGTGVGRGIGRVFANAGAAVVFHYSQSSDGAESAAAEATANGGKAKAIGANFKEFDSYKKLVDASCEFMGGIDVLVNNAGITTNVPIGEITEAQFDTLFNVNIKAQMFMTKLASAEMEKTGKGHIINISSVHAYAGMTEHSIYAATKGAIVSFTREVSLELIQKGIRVNCIAPGWVHVENQDTTLGKDFDWEEETKVVPVGFASVPEDIGNFALFLASDASRFLLGQTIIIDGGQTAIMPNTGSFREKRRQKWGTRYVERD
jgi:NAD(P)-dependent dehydrogenase (short-subunit alcohol dehydrogenase family)